jgi:hypothetical protein
VTRLQQLAEENKELRRLIAVAVRTNGNALPRWQCSGCGGAFIGRYKTTCPTCGRLNHWTGSVNAAGLATLMQLPAWKDMQRIAAIVRDVEIEEYEKKHKEL